MYDVLIKNGLIADGSGAPTFRGDVAINGQKIVRIAPKIHQRAQCEIDAANLVVAPGFIDCHNHSDVDALLGSSCYNSLEQGVTTQITGHCGYSPAPYYEGAMLRLKKHLPDDEFFQLANKAQTMQSFMHAAERSLIGSNMAFFVGHHNIRGKAMGYSAEKPTEYQLSKMQQDLIEAMEAGCLGMSTGLIYAPSGHADTKELIALAKVMAPYGGIYATHIRNESDHVLASLDEAIQIGQEAGVQVHISHLKVMGLHNAGLAGKILQRIEDANASGLCVYADQYPYTASSAALSSRIPAKYHADGMEKFLERLRQESVRNEINISDADYHAMMIAKLPVTHEYENMTVGQIAIAECKRPVDVLCDILLANDGAGQGIYFNQSEPDMLCILSHPRVFGGTDSSNFPDERMDPETYDGRHPRGQAAIVRRFQLVRDHQICSMEEAVRRITGGPAEAFHLEQQGFIKEGYDANITVFNYEKLCANATYQQPYKDNDGIHYVLVNGQIAVSDGKVTGIKAGKVLKWQK